MIIANTQKLSAPIVDQPMPGGLQWVNKSILLATLAYTGVATVLWIGGSSLASILPPTCVAVIAACMWFVSRSQPLVAGVATLFAVWCEATYTIFRLGDLEPSSLLVYPAMLVAAGMLFSEMGALVWAILTGIAIPVAMLAGRALGYYQHTEGNIVVAIVVTELAVVGSMLFARLLLRHVRAQHAETDHQRRRFEMLFQQVPDTVVEVDHAGTVREMNAAGEALFGAPRADLVGRPLARLFSEQGLPVPDPSFAGNTRDVLTLSTAPGAADLRHWEITVRREGGDSARSLLVIRDVTTRRVLADRQADLQRFEMVGRLAAGIAHDFNNLFTAIGGHASLLRAAPDEETRRFADAIAQAQQRGAKLTQQMLSFAQAGQRRPQLILVAQEMLEWTEMFRRLFGGAVALELKGEGGCFLEVDKVQLEQILLNLLANACDASPRGGTVELHVGRLTQAEAARLGSPLSAARQVMFAVVDRGSGMTIEVKRHLFEPFFTTKAPGQGTGMGLAVSYGLATQNRGAIAIESEPDRGTTARVFFPERDAPRAR